MMPLDEQERRRTQLGAAALQALGTLQSVRDGGSHWMIAVRCLSELGAAADELIADYYDALTAEELLEGTTQEIEMVEVPGGPKIAYQVAFTGTELAELRMWEEDRYMGDVVHDAALRWAREADGMRIALAKVKGSEPTRAEILTGLTLKEKDAG